MTTTDFEVILYETEGRIARITLNRPERLNAIGGGMPQELRAAVEAANRDPEVRVIILRGAGRAFCAGFDLKDISARQVGGSNPQMAGPPYFRTGGAPPTFMCLWESAKPVITQIQGYCVGGGTDMALCTDQIIAAEDALIGYPPARVWGSPLTSMWVYRLGLEQAKHMLLTGDPVDGKTAERIGLVYRAVPAEELEATVEELAARMAQIPLSQLVSMKLLINQSFENMGLRSSQLLGHTMDYLMRTTPEGLEWLQTVGEQGVREATERRDGPFADYSRRSGD